jgi:hypothetical protein
MIVETVSGKSASEALAAASKMGLPADMLAKAKEQLTKGTTFTLADDGKTMKADGAPVGQDATLTKQDSK